MDRLVADALAILDVLHIPSAHIVGHSMGGFIAQMMAIRHPDRVLSLVSASSSTSAPDLPPPPPETWEIFLANRPQNNLDRDLPGFMKVWRHLNGTASFDEGLARRYTADLYARQAVTGPLGASHVTAQEGLVDRSQELASLRVPALVIHGEKDQLVPPEGGIRTAACIPGARLVLIPEMGHMLFNAGVRRRFVEEIGDFILDHPGI